MSKKELEDAYIKGEKIYYVLIALAIVIAIAIIAIF